MRRSVKLGLAFGEELKKVSHRHGHFKTVKGQSPNWEDLLLPNYQNEDTSEPVKVWRVTILSLVMLLFFFGLFLRLFHLQVVYGSENRDRADYNRVQVRVIHAPRGVIFDRNGAVLADNNPGFRLKDKFLTRDEALSLETKGDPVSLEMEVDSIRHYPLGEVAAHVVGYVGQISADELKEIQYTDYKIGDQVGRAGIEQYYESVLKGRDGAEITEIDATGKPLRVLRRIDPVPGKNIYLSVDAELQKVSFLALQKGVESAKTCCGAAVAQNPNTGEILALVSLPSFDSNAFTDPLRSGEVSGYFNNQNSPLLNRAISGTYPPGSTFKISSALAGLFSGKITADTVVEDKGFIFLGPYRFSNWYFTQYGKTEGLIDLATALKRSNDIFFYKIGELVGEKVLGEVAGKLGLGKKVGIDLPGEADGLIPDTVWKEKNIHEVWYPGDSLHMAIGQGFLLATPLQVLSQTSFVASDGILYRPNLMQKITSVKGSTITEAHPQVLSKGQFKTVDLELVKKGLEAVPKDGGTAWPFFNFPITTAGKTGTAEIGDAQGNTHAWYTAYAPADDPKVAITVLVEKGGEGSSVAAPIAKEVLAEFFHLDKDTVNSLSNIASQSARMFGE